MYGKTVDYETGSEKVALFGVPPLMSQQLSFKPGYILQVELTSPLELVLVL